MSQKFCGNCGNLLKEGAKFCPKCGTPTNTNNIPKDGHHNNKKINLDFKKFDKKIVVPIGISIIIILSFFIWGASHYTAEKQLDKSITILGDTSQNASDIITTNSSKVEINKDNVKSIQRYFSKNPSALNSMKDNFLNNSSYHTDGTNYEFVQVGHVLLFWKKYKIKVDPEYIDISSDLEDVNIKIDGTYQGKITKHSSLSKNDTTYSNSSDQLFKKQFGPLLPGEHEVVAYKTISGKTIKSKLLTTSQNPSFTFNISQNDVKELLSYAISPSVDSYADYYVGGASNKNYQDIIRLFAPYKHVNYADSYTELSGTQITINSVTPQNNNTFTVNYNVKFIFNIKLKDEDTRTRTQIFNYQAKIKKSDDLNKGYSTNGNYALLIDSIKEIKKISDNTD